MTDCKNNGRYGWFPRSFPELTLPPGRTGGGRKETEGIQRKRPQNKTVKTKMQRWELPGDASNGSGCVTHGNLGPNSSETTSHPKKASGKSGSWGAWPCVLVLSSLSTSGCFLQFPGPECDLDPLICLANSDPSLPSQTSSIAPASSLPATRG